MKCFPIMWPEGRWRTYGRRIEVGCPDTIPWFVIAPHEAQARENHDQNLITLARRGGLDPVEAVAILTDRSWREYANVLGINSVRGATREQVQKAVDDLNQILDEVAASSVGEQRTEPETENGQ